MTTDTLTTPTPAPMLQRTIIATCDVAAGMLYVDAPYVLKAKMDALKAKYDVTTQKFSLPLTWANCLGLRTELGAELSLDQSLTDWAYRYVAHAGPLKQLRDVHDAEVALPDDKPGFAGLFAHQRTGIDLIKRSEQMNRAMGSDNGARYLVMDSTGVGKTYVALGALAVLDNPGPVVVLCPKSVIRSWRDAALLFFPDADIREVHGPADKRRKALTPGAFLYIMTYDALRAHSRVLGYSTAAALTDEQRADKEIQTLAPHTLIVDEVHRCSSPKTLQTRAAWAVADAATHVIAMTGTPIQESPEDLWAVLRMLDKQTFSSIVAYRERYLDVVINPFGGWDVRGLQERTRHEFFDLFHTMSRRALKDSVLPFLPPKVHEIRWVELPADLRRDYKKMASDYLLTDETTGEVAVADNPMVVAGRLIQLANAPLEVLPPPSPGEPETVKMVGPSPKVKAFLADVAAGDFDGTSVVVFSDSRQLLDLCAAEMDAAGLEHTEIVGDSTAEERNEAIERFQRGDVPFILISRAGDTGITLTKASVMVRLTRAWSYITHTQAEDRVHRIGSEQHESITYIDYVTQDTLEEGQIVRLNTKREKAGAVLDHHELKEMLKK